MTTSKIGPPIIELARARTKEFLRETEAIFWVFGFPLLLALVLGFAFRDKAPDKVPVGVAAGPLAQQRLAALQKSDALQPRIVSDGEDALRHGKISLLVSGDAALVYDYDRTRPDALTARSAVDDALQRAAGRRDPLAPRQNFVHEQGARYIDFLLPGLLGMNLMGTGMWGTGFVIVNARMKKLLKRFIATPMRKRDYVLSHFLSRIVFLVLEVGVLVAFGWLVFGVRVNGSVLTLALLCIIGGFAFSGLGLLTASRARTIEAASGLMNVIMMPMWLCSGVFFSYDRFPDAVKPVIKALPLTILNDALRGVMNDAMTLAQIGPKLLFLIVWGVVTFSVGVKIFRWQ
ncbi:MAG TPA: ABC transporter permease [Thermoanaerobaculia bacterium]|nr:ABC transporter permease [Thermoanaerobaculia bacterium]